jgi:hypothetical protein
MEILESKIQIKLKKYILQMEEVDIVPVLLIFLVMDLVVEYLVTVNSNGSITSTQVVAGGYGYTWGIVDLGSLQPGGSLPNPAKLIPIIPPSKGHGYDIYTELGTDKVLVYARFDDSTKDFPTDTKFAQVGIIKNPTTFNSDTVIFTENQYSSL